MVRALASETNSALVLLLVGVDSAGGLGLALQQHPDRVGEVGQH